MARRTIALLKRRLEEHERGWRGWFAARGIAPLEIPYEALAADPAATVCKILAHLGLDTDGVEIPVPRMSRQADSPLAGVVRALPRAGAGVSVQTYAPPRPARELHALS